MGQNPVLVARFLSRHFQVLEKLGTLACMEGVAKSRLWSAVQLMRLPLVITAISNTQVAYLLAVADGRASWSLAAAGMLLLMSVGLYGFGMVANDIVDVHRDQFLAPHRPLAAGRLGIREAYLLAGILLLLGLTGGAVWALVFSGGWISLFFLLWTVVLIFFYNGMGKFVEGVGIVTLGLIRFFHAAVAQPKLGIVWHPLLLLDHVCLLSAICYVLESKRPRLNAGHWWLMGISLAGLNILLAGGLALATWLRRDLSHGLLNALGVRQGLLWPLLAVLVFVALTAALLLPLRDAHGMSNRQLLDRQHITGRRLMVLGLIGLIIYDIAFVYGYF